MASIAHLAALTVSLAVTATASPQTVLVESSAPGVGSAMADSGRYVVGVADPSIFTQDVQVAIWSPTGTWTEIGGIGLHGIDISNDGLVVIARDDLSDPAFDTDSVWTPIGGWQPIPGPAGRRAQSLSADGNVVAVSVRDPQDPFDESSYTWNRLTGAILPLNPVSSAPGITRVNDLSADGSVAGGESNGSAVIWNAAGVPTVIVPTASNETARVLTVSRDGDFAGGSRTVDFVETPFIWSATTGVIDLPALGMPGLAGNASRATRISTDGDTVIGQHIDTTDPSTFVVETFFWTANGGTERLHDRLLALAGVPVGRHGIASMSDDAERFFAVDTWVDLDADPGTNFCNQPFPNSTGELGEIHATGSVFAELNDLTLTATKIAPQQFGMFIGSDSRGFVPNAGNIVLCLTNNVLRFNGPGQAQSSGAAGTISLTLDLSGGPGSILPPVLPGSTWYFQCWFRDTVGMGSSMTNAVAVSFE